MNTMRSPPRSATAGLDTIWPAYTLRCSSVWNRQRSLATLPVQAVDHAGPVPHVHRVVDDGRGGGDHVVGGVEPDPLAGHPPWPRSAPSHTRWRTSAPASTPTSASHRRRSVRPRPRPSPTHRRRRPSRPTPGGPRRADPPRSPASDRERQISTGGGPAPPPGPARDRPSTVPPWPVVAVANQKGGVGKTTVTLGIADAAARRGPGGAGRRSRSAGQRHQRPGRGRPRPHRGRCAGRSTGWARWPTS